MVNDFDLKMNLYRLETEVHQKAKEFLEEINEENLKTFAESTKLIAQSVFEEYILEVDRQYTNGVFKIEDIALLDKFMDFKNGYRSTMKDWIAEKGITLQELKIDPTISCPNLSKEDLAKLPMLIGGLGTLVAVGIFITSNVWVALAAELLCLGIAAAVYEKQKNNLAKDYAFRLKKYKKQIQGEKDRLVNGLIKDLKGWLSAAEQYSQDTLSDLGV
jgi:hypothetical protein